MALDKAIQSGKEKRQPYRKSRAFDASCRNHGSCPYCYHNRRYNTAKRLLDASERLAEYYASQPS